MRSKAWQWVELFAGKRACTRAVLRSGIAGTCVDIEDSKRYNLEDGRGSCFDILSSSGFTKLAYIMGCVSLFNEVVCQMSTGELDII